MEINNLTPGQLAERLDNSKDKIRRGVGIERKSSLIKKPINFRFEEDIYTFLKREAALLKVDTADLIRFGLRRWVETELELAEKSPPTSTSYLMKELSEQRASLRKMELMLTSLIKEKVSDEVATPTNFNQSVELEIEMDDSTSVLSEEDESSIVETPNKDSFYAIVGSKFTTSKASYQIWDIREVDGVKKYFIDKKQPELSATREQLEELATFTSHPSKPGPVVKMKPKLGESSKEKITKEDFETLADYYEEYGLIFNPNIYEILDN